MCAKHEPTRCSTIVRPILEPPSNLGVVHVVDHSVYPARFSGGDISSVCVPDLEQCVVKP
jgi:hypothetical protein